MIKEHLKYLVDKNGSDLHIKVGNKPMIRVDGELMFIENTESVLPNDMKEIADKMLDGEAKDIFKREKNIDLSYSLQGIGRFRINMYVQRGTIAISARVIKLKMQSMEELGLPSVLKDFVMEKRGLVLVTGATGNGKSTTVSTMLEYINQNYTRNIITLEDPIEYLFKDKQSIVSQREIPNDMGSYSQALRYILRQDPDIIFIGELRDKETIDAALKAAETGHLVISTLHTVNASQTINRILDYYPTEQQKQVRFQLSSNLKAVVSQRLLRTLNNHGRVVALEIMLSTPSIREKILSAEGVKDIPDLIKSGKTVYQMQTFDQAISELYLDKRISYETALEAATVKKDIELLEGGITYSTSADIYKESLKKEEYDDWL